MSKLSDEIAAYEVMRDALETDSLGKWALVHQRKLVGTFDSFDSAAAEAVREFGRGPYLIRRVGASAVTLPASVMYSVPRA